MKTGVAILTAFLSLGSALYGQAAPTAVATDAPGLAPTLNSSGGDGALHFSLSASEIAQLGQSNFSGTNYTTSLSGNAAYSSKSPVLPFNLLYAGGLLLTNQARNTVQTFQNASISQGYVSRGWILGVSDSVSYLPQSPTTGLSGIPGVGDLGSLQGPAQGPAGGILNNYGKRLSNSLGGDIERRLGANTSISGSSSWEILRFLDGGGLENTSISAQGALNHRLDVRDTISGSFAYSTFSYSQLAGNLSGLSDLTFQTKGFNAQFQRLLSRSLSLNASAGPQWISSSDSTLIPSRLSAAAAVSLTYSRKLTTAGLSYTRGASGGSGIQQGTIADSIAATVGRSFGRDWLAGLTGSYTHSSGLITNSAAASLLSVTGGYDSVYGGVQVSRRIGTHFSGYVSYTAQEQSSRSAVASQNAFSGTYQVFGAGITYSPRSARLGQF